MSDCLKTWELVRYLSKPWFLLPLVQMAPLAHLPLPTPVQAWQIRVRWTSTWAKIFFRFLSWVSLSLLGISIQFWFFTWVSLLRLSLSTLSNPRPEESFVKMLKLILLFPTSVIKIFSGLSPTLLQKTRSLEISVKTRYLIRLRHDEVKIQFFNQVLVVLDHQPSMSEVLGEEVELRIQRLPPNPASLALARDWL